MNQLLMTELARQELAERLQAAERERMARRSSTPARRPSGRVGRMARSLRMSLSAWRARTQLGSVTVPMCGDDCVEATPS